MRRRMCFVQSLLEYCQSQPKPKLNQEIVGAELSHYTNSPEYKTKVNLYLI